MYVRQDSQLLGDLLAKVLLAGKMAAKLPVFDDVVDEEAQEESALLGLEEQLAEQVRRQLMSKSKKAMGKRGLKLARASTRRSGVPRLRGLLRIRRRQLGSLRRRWSSRLLARDVVLLETLICFGGARSSSSACLPEVSKRGLVPSASCTRRRGIATNAAEASLSGKRGEG